MTAVRVAGCAHQAGVRREQGGRVVVCVTCGETPVCPRGHAVEARDSAWVGPYLACSDRACDYAHGFPVVLAFMGIKGTLTESFYGSSTRCLCLTRPNLRALVKDGEVVEAGCPVCRHPWPGEYVRAGNRWGVDFFPPGITVIAA